MSTPGRWDTDINQAGLGGGAARKSLRNVRNSEGYIWTIMKFFVNRNFEIAAILMRNCII